MFRIRAICGPEILSGPYTLKRSNRQDITDMLENLLRFYDRAQLDLLRRTA
jgi:hypothetical protein